MLAPKKSDLLISMVNKKNIFESSSSFGENLSAAHLFGLVIISGLLIILLGTLFFRSWFLTLFGPLLIMWLYTYRVAHDEKSEITTEQKADSVYYLGFIYTLVAMASSLIVIAQNQDSFREIVVNFGLALATTIVGLVVRIIWLQLNVRSLEDSEEVFKDKLMKKSQQLQQQTDMLVSALGALSSKMNSVAGPLQNNFSNLSKSFLIPEQINNDLEKLSNSSKSISQNFQNLALSSASLSPELDTLTPKFATLNNNLSSSISEISKALSILEAALNENQEILETNKSNMIKNLNLSQKMLAEVHDSLKQSADFISDTLK